MLYRVDLRGGSEKELLTPGKGDEAMSSSPT